MKFLLVAVSLGVGNFLYCKITNTSYDVAIERTYFQAFAILVCWITV